MLPMNLHILPRAPTAPVARPQVQTQQEVEMATLPQTTTVAVAAAARPLESNTENRRALFARESTPAPSTMAQSAATQVENMPAAPEVANQQVENMPAAPEVANQRALSSPWNELHNHCQEQMTLRATAAPTLSEPAARHVTFRDRIASFVSPLTSFLARSSTGSAPVAPETVTVATPRPLPTMEELLNGQYATIMKLNGFMCGSLGYQFFKFFSFLANPETKTLIGRISTLETSAAAVKAAANRVAKALSNEEKSPKGIQQKQERLRDGAPTTKTERANKELAASLHSFMEIAQAFVQNQQPVEGPFLGNHTAYTQVLGKLIQNNTVGVTVTNEALENLSDLNFMAGSTVRNETVAFAKQVEKALAEDIENSGTELPNLMDVIESLQETLGTTRAKKAFIMARFLKKLGCDSLGLLEVNGKKGSLQKFAEIDATTMALPKLEREAAEITATINGYAVKLANLQEVQTDLTTQVPEKRMAYVDAMFAHIERIREARLGKVLPQGQEAIYAKYKANKNIADLEPLAILAFEVKVQPMDVTKPPEADKDVEKTWDAIISANNAYEAAKMNLSAAQKAVNAELIAVFGKTLSEEEGRVFEADTTGKITGFKLGQTADGKPKGFADMVRDIPKPNSKLALELAKLDANRAQEPAIREAFIEKQSKAIALYTLIRDFKTAVEDHRANQFEVSDLLGKVLRDDALTHASVGSSRSSSISSDSSNGTASAKQSLDISAILGNSGSTTSVASTPSPDRDSMAHLDAEDFADQDAAAPALVAQADDLEVLGQVPPTREKRRPRSAPAVLVEAPVAQQPSNKSLAAIQTAAAELRVSIDAALAHEIASLTVTREQDSPAISHFSQEEIAELNTGIREANVAALAAREDDEHAKNLAELRAISGRSAIQEVEVAVTDEHARNLAAIKLSVANLK